MKLFIDTSQKNFVACVFNKNNEVLFKSTIETKYKVEEIINFFDQIDCFHKINKIYINLGPGSFTGSRIALLYIRTMAQVNNEIEIFTTNTFKLLSKQIKNKLFKTKLYISATKNKSYCFSKNKISIVDKSKKEKQIDYVSIIENFSFYENVFQLCDLSLIKPIYASDPQIGEMK